MRSNSLPTGAKDSFIGEARRAQIIESTIQSVADEGYAGASLAKVAKRASISKSVIVYHFGGKDRLLEATVEMIYKEIWDFIRPGFEQESSTRGKLRTFIESEFAFMQQNRARLLAVSYILPNHRDSDGVLQLRDQAEKGFLESVESILGQGQKNGEFRSFAIRPMAATLMHAINGALAQWVTDPRLNLRHYEAELVKIFDLATRK